MNKTGARENWSRRPLEEELRQRLENAKVELDVR